MALARAADVLHKAADCLRAFVLQQDLTGPAEMAGALFGAWVIQGDGKVPLGGAAQAQRDLLPRGQQVRQGDDAEVVHQGGPQHRRPGQGRRDTGHHLDLHLPLSLRHLEDGAGHGHRPRASPLHSMATVRPLRAVSKAQRHRASSWVMGVV